MKVIARYKRIKDSIDGLFSIIAYDNSGKEILAFNNLPARSGQYGFRNSSWHTGKSPIPYSHEVAGGQLYIHLLTILQQGKWALQDPKGIGENRLISSSPNDPYTIHHATLDKKRTAVGIHPENWWKGSAGCVVLVNDTLFQKMRILLARTFINYVAKSKKYIELEVM